MSSFLSRSYRGLSHILAKPTVRVCGLLGTYNIEGGAAADDDFWMATDFIALRQLIGAHDNLSEWFCGIPIRTQRGFLLGDPACDRIVFDPPPFETVLDVQPEDLAFEFLVAVRIASSKLDKNDTLVIVLVGHGDDKSHSFIVGDENQFSIPKERLERAVRGTKGNILVINTACFSGSWTSDRWTLLAAAGPEQTSASIVASGSGECRGGFFTNALLAEHADEFNIRPPYPGTLDDYGRRLPQRNHDFGPHKMNRPSRRRPKRSMTGVLDWIYRFGRDIGRTYLSADVIFHPCQLGSHNLPFASLITERAPFHKLICVGPSPANDHASIRSANGASSIPIPPRRVLSPEMLSEDEEATLVKLAADHLFFMPPSVPSELPTILQCHRLIYSVKLGRDPLNNTKRLELYSTLTRMANRRNLALVIAKNLGWERAVTELGEPGGLQRQVVDVIPLRREAEASGCLVSVLTFPVNAYTRWSGAAGWLTRVWEASGRPIVLPDDWTRALEGLGCNNGL